MSIRMRHTRGHTRNRRSHHALRAMNLITDAETGAVRLPHRVDEATGMYRGKQIFTPKVKKQRAHTHKVHGPDTEPRPKGAPSGHEIHMNAEAKGARGVSGKVPTGGRPKARSGMGGGA